MYPVNKWEQSGSIWEKQASGALYQIHEYGDHFIVYKFQYNGVARSLGPITAWFIAGSWQTAKRWANTHTDIDTDPWDNTPEACADRTVRLRELHELEKEQDRYRIHN